MTIWKSGFPCILHDGDASLPLQLHVIEVVVKDNVITAGMGGDIHYGDVLKTCDAPLYSPAVWWWRFSTC